MNLLGAGMWALVMILLVAILVAVHVGHRHHRRDVLPRNRYQSVRRDKKKRLLGDKYYHDSKYEK